MARQLGDQRHIGLHAVQDQRVDGLQIRLQVDCQAVQGVFRRPPMCFVKKRQDHGAVIAKKTVVYEERMNKHNTEVIETTLLRGRVKLLQPKVGFHASIDSVLLAAAVPVKDRYKVLDVGCGVGSVGLCVAARNKTITLTGIDVQPELVDLACQNAVLNDLDAQFFAGNIKGEKHTDDNAFNVVVMNPPYLEGGAHTPSPEKIKATSHGEGASGATLTDWIKYAHRKLKQGGHLVMIHRADRLDHVIMELEKKRWFGSLVVYPLWSHAGEDAKRVIIQARKERYAPIVLKPGMVIHEKNGQYTGTAHSILSDAEAIIL